MAILIYSRNNPAAQIYDRRVLHFDRMGHKSTYVNGFSSLTKTLFRTELDETRSRVKTRGKHSAYTPSTAWHKKFGHLTTKTFDYVFLRP